MSTVAEKEGIGQGEPPKCVYLAKKLARLYQETFMKSWLCDQ